MGQNIATPDIHRSIAHRIDPSRLAWGVLLLAFALFCLICVFVIIGVDFFLFQSTVPMTATLSVGRGSVSVTDLTNRDERVGRSGLALSKGVVVSTDPTQQGTIRFTDDRDQLLAAMTLHRSASVTILEAARPRFEWSRTRHEITLDNVVGEIDIDIPARVNADIRLSAQTPAGAIVNFLDSGDYIVEAASEQLRVFNRRGTANIISPDLQGGWDIPVNGLGIVNYADNLVELKPGYVNFLVDDNFETVQRDGIIEGAEPAWVCGNDPDDDPPGLYNLIEINGVQVLQFQRASGATTHGRTSCVQSFGQAGVEISEDVYDFLALRATFYVDFQSLAGCGTRGSECPLMLRMDYIDVEGEARQWFHGFYAQEEGNYPVRCSTCSQDHDQLNEKAWYTYESPNLLSFFKPEPDEAFVPDLTPRTIVALWIYASGHQYDVWIDEVALIAAQP